MYPWKPQTITGVDFKICIVDEMLNTTTPINKECEKVENKALLPEDIRENDINLVMNQTGKNRETSIQSIIANNGDLVETIMSLVD